MALHWTIPSGIFQVCQVCRQDIQDKVLENNEDLPLEGNKKNFIKLSFTKITFQIDTTVM